MVVGISCSFVFDVSVGVGIKLVVIESENEVAADGRNIEYLIEMNAIIRSATLKCTCVSHNKCIMFIFIFSIYKPLLMGKYEIARTTRPTP